MALFPPLRNPTFVRETNVNLLGLVILYVIVSILWFHPYSLPTAHSARLVVTHVLWTSKDYAYVFPIYKDRLFKWYFRDAFEPSTNSFSAYLIPHAS